MTGIGAALDVDCATDLVVDVALAVAVAVAFAVAVAVALVFEQIQSVSVEQLAFLQKPPVQNNPVAQLALLPQVPLHEFGAPVVVLKDTLLVPAQQLADVPVFVLQESEVTELNWTLQS